MDAVGKVRNKDRNAQHKQSDGARGMDLYAVASSGQVPGGLQKRGRCKSCSLWHECFAEQSDDCGYQYEPGSDE